MTNAVSRAGFGKPGYCKLCSFADEPALNERIKSGWNARQIGDWLRDKYGVTANRQTIYKHQKEHLRSAEDRLVSAVEKQRAKGAVIPRTSTNDQFLEAVRDAGYQKVIDNPDEVTIDQSLKASQILANQKQSTTNLTIVLAKIMSGGDTADYIEGEAVDVTGVQ